MASAEEAKLTEIQDPVRTCVVVKEAVDEEEVPDNKTEDQFNEKVNDELNEDKE